MGSTSNLYPDTLAVHAVRTPDPATGAVSPSIQTLGDSTGFAVPDILTDDAATYAVQALVIDNLFHLGAYGLEPATMALGEMRRGLPPEQRLALGNGIVAICAELLQVPSRSVLGEFTSHAADEILRDGTWADEWSAHEADARCACAMDLIGSYTFPFVRRVAVAMPRCGARPGRACRLADAERRRPIPVRDRYGVAAPRRPLISSARAARPRPTEPLRIHTFPTVTSLERPRHEGDIL